MSNENWGELFSRNPDEGGDYRNEDLIKGLLSESALEFVTAACQSISNMVVLEHNTLCEVFPEYKAVFEKRMRISFEKALGLFLENGEKFKENATKTLSSFDGISHDKVERLVNRIYDKQVEKYREAIEELMEAAAAGELNSKAMAKYAVSISGLSISTVAEAAEEVDAGLGDLFTDGRDLIARCSDLTYAATYEDGSRVEQSNVYPATSVVGASISDDDINSALDEWTKKE